MLKYKHVVIGAGSAGLVVAIGLAKAKKKVLLIEDNLFGGDCTNYGCIPSKTLIASAKMAHNLKIAHEFGLDFKIEDFRCDNVFQRVKNTIENIRSKEDENALKKIGIDTIKAKASFLTDKILQTEDENQNTQKISFKKLIIATGSKPIIPKIKGLENSPFDTNETIFNLKRLPKSLAILGSGAIGCELAQAFQRLGTKVTLIDIAPNVLFQEDYLASDLLKDTFEKENITLHLNSEASEIKYENDIFNIFVKNQETNYITQVKSEKLLIATGRDINIDSLKLHNADISHNKSTIHIDKYSRTNKKHIFAIGDVVGRPFFTHKAEYMARSVLFSLLVPFVKKKISLQDIPRVTFTDPEIASVGLTENEAIETFGKKKIATYYIPFEDLDRAICESDTNGFVKIITKKYSSHILGACIASKRAGEMLSEILLAIKTKTSFYKIASIIHPYPTYSLAIRNAADKYITQTLAKK